MLKKLIAINLENNDSQELDLTDAAHSHVIEFMEKAPGGTLLVFLPEAATEKAIVMCPGGGFRQVNMQHEGYDYAEWFDAQSITYSVLKYRLPEGNEHTPAEDITRAIRLLRQGETGRKPRCIHWRIYGCICRHFRPCRLSSATLSGHQHGKSLDASAFPRTDVR